MNDTQPHRVRKGSRREATWHHCSRSCARRALCSDHEQRVELLTSSVIGSQAEDQDYNRFRNMMRARWGFRRLSK